MLSRHWQDLIDDHPVLTAEDERFLAHKRDAASSDEERARCTKQLVLHNLRGAVKRLRAMNAKECDQDDLMQEMVIGLMKAADRWKPMEPGANGKAPRFIHYAFLYLREGAKKGARKMWRDDASIDAMVEQGDVSSDDGVYCIGYDEQDHSLLDLSLLDRLTKAERAVVQARVLDVTHESDAELASRVHRDPERITRLLRSGLLKLLGHKPPSRAGGYRPRPRRKRNVQLSLTPQITSALKANGVNISGLVDGFLAQYARKHNLVRRTRSKS